MDEVRLLEDVVHDLEDVSFQPLFSEQRPVDDDGDEAAEGRPERVALSQLEHRSVRLVQERHDVVGQLGDGVGRHEAENFFDGLEEGHQRRDAADAEPVDGRFENFFEKVVARLKRETNYSKYRFLKHQNDQPKLGDMEKVQT